MGKDKTDDIKLNLNKTTSNLKDALKNEKEKRLFHSRSQSRQKAMSIH